MIKNPERLYYYKDGSIGFGRAGHCRQVMTKTGFWWMERFWAAMQWIQMWTPVGRVISKMSGGSACPEPFLWCVRQKFWWVHSFRWLTGVVGDSKGEAC